MKAWDEQAFAAAYSYRGQPSYNRAHFVVNSDFGYIRKTLLDVIGRNLLTPSQKVLFVGCGFNWWREFIVTNVPGAVPDNYYGLDTSAYIHANKATESVDPEYILDYDLNDPNILNLLKPHFGGNGKVTWGLSTLVLTSLQTDQEITDFSASLRSVTANNGNVGHIFTSASAGSDTTLGMNWQTRDYWSDRLGATDWLFDIQGGFAVWNPSEGVWA